LEPHNFSIEQQVQKMYIKITRGKESTEHQYLRQGTEGTILTYSVALVRKRTIPTEQQPLVGEVSANFCG
jgi:hypothetical protein